MTNTFKLFIVAGLSALFAITSMILFAPERSTGDLDAQMREFILNNPEVLFESVERYELAQQQAQAERSQSLITELADEIYRSEDDVVFGNPDGDIVMVEFLDYRCGYCKKAHPEVKTLLETDGNVKLIVKEYPVLGEDSVTAARFAIAVRQLGGDDAYRAVHDAMMSARGSLGPRALQTLATDAGVDPEAVFEQMQSDEVTAVLARTQALGQQLGIQGTPNFIVNDEMIRGYVPYDKMVELIASLR